MRFVNQLFSTQLANKIRRRLHIGKSLIRVNRGKLRLAVFNLFGTLLLAIPLAVISFLIL